MTKRTRPTYPDYLNEQFTRDTAGHEMTVMLDAGVYRHLRFASPENSWNACFELITWPGGLTYAGDIGGFTFRRTRDMFELFRGNRINPDYWAQKVTAGNDALKTYSETLTREKIWWEVRDEIKEFKGLAKAVHASLNDRWITDVSTEDGARRFLDDFGYNTDDGRTFIFTDHDEWDLRDWNWGFLWSCHAIQWGIRQYDAAKAVAPDAEAAKVAA
jgi:hypothetical protein